MKEIEQAWKSFERIPFPSNYAGAEMRNIDVVSLDTFAAGCFDSFISSNGKLDPRKFAILQDCIQDTGDFAFIRRLRAGLLP